MPEMITTFDPLTIMAYGFGAGAACVFIPRTLMLPVQLLRKFIRT